MPVHTVPMTPISAAGLVSRLRASTWSRAAAFWLAAGALLRLLFVFFPRLPDDDTDAYLQLGHTLFHQGTYGFLEDGVASPALFRLPGYPIFLELLNERMPLVFLVQSSVELVGCLLLGLLVRRLYGQRAGLATLALACACPFTATYAATAMTESLSIFAVAAALYALGRHLQAFSAFEAVRKTRLPLAACASLAMLLRPDGTLLTLAVAAALIAYGFRAGDSAPALLRRALLPATAFLLLAAIPLIPWTIRNARTFHVLQPLAPRHVNDPGERVNLGFYRWLRTWSVDFQTTSQVFWHVGTEPILLSSLPARAFDSPAELDQTTELLRLYNLHHDLDPALDDRFNALAAERIQRAPLRYFVAVPLLRVADMWLRPRTEGMSLDLAWWQWQLHPGSSAISALLALLNLAYILAALAGLVILLPALRTNARPDRRAMLVCLLTYLVLRCALLATIENPEPRYTLEAFPIVFVLAGIAVSKMRRRPTTQLLSAPDQESFLSSLPLVVAPITLADTNQTS